MTDWYFEDKGQQRGPIPENDLALMFANRLLPQETRVWTAAFGQQWKAAAQTQFADVTGAAVPPPLTAAPPSQSVRALNDKFAKWIAFIPLIILGVDLIFVMLGADPSVPLTLPLCLNPD